MGGSGGSGGRVCCAGTGGGMAGAAAETAAAAAMEALMAARDGVKGRKARAKIAGWVSPAGGRARRRQRHRSSVPRRVCTFEHV